MYYYILQKTYKDSGESKLLYIRSPLVVDIPHLMLNLDKKYKHTKLDLLDSFYYERQTLKIYKYDVDCELTTLQKVVIDLFILFDESETAITNFSSYIQDSRLSDGDPDCPELYPEFSNLDIIDLIHTSAKQEYLKEEL